MASDTGIVNVEEAEVAEGYTMTQFCDKMIEYFMHVKPQTKDWRKLLVFRDDWKKYKGSFFKRCQVRVETEKDPVTKQKLVVLARKMKKVSHYLFYLVFMNRLVGILKKIVDVHFFITYIRR